MITYLIYSSVSLAVLLLFYHLLLEKEKMHKMNRVFLIFSLLFSLTIPLIPVGIDNLQVQFISFFEKESVEPSVTLEREWLEDEAELAAATGISSESDHMIYLQSVLLIYILISIGLFVRLLRIIHTIELKADRNVKRLHEGIEVVLLNEDVIPHTFLNKIFLNREKYLKGEIPGEVMIHEFTHVRQKHSLDILLIEFLKILFWFNPILYLYKRAILLNHEFLADEEVISRGSEVRNYQGILLNSLLKTPAYRLVNTFNFSLTKKRLRMMTKPKSACRSAFKTVALLPLIVTISLLPACESISSEYSDEKDAPDRVSIEITSNDLVLVNNNLMTLAELDNYFLELTEPPNVVSMQVHTDATFGTITDVQTRLRRHGAFRINYSTTRVSEKNE